MSVPDSKWIKAQKGIYTMYVFPFAGRQIEKKLKFIKWIIEKTSKTYYQEKKVFFIVETLKET